MINLENFSITYNYLDNLLSKIENRVFINTSYKFSNNGLYFIQGDEGTGKTTILKALSGFVKFDKNSQKIEFNNCDYKSASNKMWDNLRNKYINVVLQDTLINEELTLNEYLLDYLSDEKHIKEECKESIDNLLKDFGLYNYKDVKIKNIKDKINRGFLRILKSLIIKKPIMLIDEPDLYCGKYLNQVMGYLINYSMNSLVIITTQNIDFANSYKAFILKIENHKIIEVKKEFVIENIIVEHNVNKYKISFVNQIKKSFSIFKNSLLKIVVCAMLVAISCGLIGMSFSLSNYKNNSGIAEAIKNLNENNFYISCNTSKSSVISQDIDKLSETTGLKLTKSMSLIHYSDVKPYSYYFYNYTPMKEDFENDTYMSTDYIRHYIIYAMYFSYDSNLNYLNTFDSFIPIESMSQFPSNYKLLAGSLPLNDNEILLTDYQFDAFKYAGFIDSLTQEKIDSKDIDSPEKLIGKHLNFFNYNFYVTISGVIDTQEYDSSKAKEIIDNSYSILSKESSILNSPVLDTIDDFTNKFVDTFVTQLYVSKNIENYCLSDISISYPNTLTSSTNICSNDSVNLDPSIYQAPYFKNNDKFDVYTYQRLKDYVLFENDIEDLNENEFIVSYLLYYDYLSRYIERNPESNIKKTLAIPQEYYYNVTGGISVTYNLLNYFDYLNSIVGITSENKYEDLPNLFNKVVLENYVDMFQNIDDDFNNIIDSWYKENEKERPGTISDEEKILILSYGLKHRYNSLSINNVIIKKALYNKLDNLVYSYYELQNELFSYFKDNLEGNYPTSFVFDNKQMLTLKGFTPLKGLVFSKDFNRKNVEDFENYYLSYTLGIMPNDDEGYLNLSNAFFNNGNQYKIYINNSEQLMENVNKIVNVGYAYLIIGIILVFLSIIYLIFLLSDIYLKNKNLIYTYKTFGASTLQLRNILNLNILSTSLLAFVISIPICLILLVIVNGLVGFYVRLNTSYLEIVISLVSSLLIYFIGLLIFFIYRRKQDKKFK